MGRVWESPDGNLYCSTLVRLQAGDPLPHTLALVAANAVHALVAPLCAGQARIKWPYDVLIAGQARRRGAMLVTANEREFARVPGLRMEDWAAA